MWPCRLLFSTSLCLFLIGFTFSVSDSGSGIQFKHEAYFSYADSCEFSSQQQSILNSTTVSDIDGCAQLCKMTQGCTHFIFSSTDNKCSLFDGLMMEEEGVFGPSSMSCGIMFDQSHPTHFNWQNTTIQYTWARGCTFLGDGNILKQKRVRNFGKCGILCAYIEPCTHFSFATENNTCFLQWNYANDMNAVEANNFACGYMNQQTVPTDFDWTRPMTGGTYTWGKECSFNDNNILNEVNTTSHETCASVCESTLRCTHFVFSTRKTDLNCRLLQGRVDNKNATYMPKSECGYMDNQLDIGEIDWKENPSTGYIWAYNCEFSDKNILNDTNAIDDPSCATVCTNTRGCTHYEYFLDNQTCSLHYSPAARGDARLANITSVNNGRATCGFSKIQSQPDFFWSWYNVTTGTDCSFSSQLEKSRQTEIDIHGCVESCLNKECSHFTWLNSKQVCTFFFDPRGLISETDAFFEPGFTCGIIRKKGTPKSEIF